MYAFCLLLSLIATALGVFAIGFGIPIHDFSLGNTLIVAGATGVAAGIVMFGIACAVRQLRRIADALTSQGAAAPRRQPVAEPAEAPSPQRPSGPPRIPYPPRPGADPRDPRLEQRPLAPPEPPEPPPMPGDRARPNIFGRDRNGGSEPQDEEHEDMAPGRVPGGAAPPEPRPHPPEPRPASPGDIMARLTNLASAPPRSPPRSEPPRMPTDRPAPPEPRRGNAFDSVWPVEGRGSRQSQPETIARAPRPEVRPEARPEPRLDSRPDMRAEPRLEPKPEPRFEPPMGRAEPPPPAGEPRTIAILKSGVIDGMAYTLYTDGSIEAELPQGTMRFASIEELRLHLENADREP